MRVRSNIAFTFPWPPDGMGFHGQPGFIYDVSPEQFDALCQQVNALGGVFEEVPPDTGPGGGVKGDKGDPGDPGPPGAASTVPGPPGPASTVPGPPGADGHTPVKNVDYFDGAPGTPGSPGVKGDKGDPGNQGTQGIQGNPGTPGSQGPPGADSTVPGPQGNPGTAGADGKTVRSGTGAPASGLGVAGDFYIDTAANMLYGPKTTVWPAGVSIVGAQGTPGTQGIQGSPGNNAPSYGALANGTTAMAFGTVATRKVTPTATATFTTTVPAAGTMCVLMVLTSGTTSFTITFGSGFKSSGTLATSTTTGRIFLIHWTSDGTNLYETGRTASIVA